MSPTSYRAAPSRVSGADISHYPLNKQAFFINALLIAELISYCLINSAEIHTVYTEEFYSLHEELYFQDENGELQ